MTKLEVEPLLQEFTENLASKNVSAEIAEEICKSVEKALINQKTASYTSVKQTV